MNDTTVAVYGLGKLGLPLASVISRLGYETIGYDWSKERMTEIRQLQAVARSSGDPLMAEPNVQLRSDYLSFVDEPPKADICFIVVPTPSDVSGSFRLDFVIEALRKIQAANQGSRTTAVLVSTVMPGSCHLLNTIYGSQDLQIVYNPTFIALGSVVRDLMEPNLLLIGTDEAIKPPKCLSDLWDNMLDTDVTHCVLAPFIEIELLKLSVNAALGTKIALANSLGALFEAYGANPEMVKTLEKDPRLGMGYFTPGSPISGPCLPRDNKALRTAAHKVNKRMWLSEATDDIDHDVRMDILARITKYNPETVGILGMTYKYGIPVEDGSIGSWLRSKLREVGVEVACYDDVLRNTDPFDDVMGAEVIVVAHKEMEKRATGHSKVIAIWP